MSNITFGPRLIEQQLAASNRLFRSGYEIGHEAGLKAAAGYQSGYEAGVKYAIGKFEEMVERMIPAPAIAEPLDPCDVGSPTDRV